MSTIRLIAEMGSCHMGKLEYAKEAIDLSDTLQLHALKFQLFPNTPKFTDSGNVALSKELFLKIWEYAQEQDVNISASVFDENSFRFLLDLHPKFIKFSYSQKHQTPWILETLGNGIEAIVSCDVMTEHLVPKGATKLFCISQYPVHWQVRFDNLFPRFEGFSDHTMGIDQSLEAIYEGATILEKHFKLGHADITCPDSYFALTPYELSALSASLRKIERDGSL